MVTAQSLLDPGSLRPLKRVEYERLVVEGCFEHERVELLYGAIVHMNAKGPAHDGVVRRLNKLLSVSVGDRGFVRVQSAFAASDHSEPEPDIAVVSPTDDELEAHPSTALWIIEVAESSLKHDRTTKAQLYAESGVPEYWIVDLVHGLIEVYTDIVDGAYVRVMPFGPGETIRPRSFADIEVVVANIVR
jgi:Uma2 family endonuclease